MHLSTQCCLLAGLVVQHTAYGFLAGEAAPVVRLVGRQVQPGEMTASYDTAAMPAEDGSNRIMATDDYDTDKVTKVQKRAPSAADWKSRCPGGRVGDAKQCSFQPHRIYQQPLTRWRNYGNRVTNCDGDTDIQTSVSERSTVSNTIEETTTTEVSLSLGVGIEDVSVGFDTSVSHSYSESWTHSNSLTETTSITVSPGNEGGMLVYNDFQLSEGRVRIVYDDQVEGHWTWYLNDVKVWNLVTGSTPVYSPDVGECPHGSTVDAYWYWDDEYDAMLEGNYNSYEYPENSDDPNCSDC